jgi:hypothetical protein
MRRMLGLLLALSATPALGATLKAPDGASLSSIGSFSKQPGRRGSPTITVEMLRGVQVTGKDARKREDFWILEEVVTGPKQPTHRQWADSRTCPAMTVVLRDAEALSPPSVRLTPEPLAEHDGFVELVVTVDAPSYTLDAPARWAGGGEGAVRITGGDDTPVGGWVGGALKALAPCWSNKPQF